MLIKRFTAGLLALSMLIGITGCSLPNLRRTETSDTEKEIVSTKETDMTVADPDSDYGLIYYTPTEEEHIVQLSEDDVMQYIDNDVLLVSNEGVSRDKIFELAEKYDAEVVGEIEVSGDYQPRLNGIYDIDELDSIVDELCDEDIVYDAYPNYVMPYEVEGKIEDINKAWSNNEDNVAWGFNAINAAQAQAELNKPSYKSKPVRVGVVDEGFDIDHEDLGFVEVFYDNGRNGVNNEDKNHGTHVSGTFAATTGNGIGIDGVYPYGAGNLYGVADGVYDYDENAPFSKSVMTQKIEYSELIVRNVKVINQSQGFNFYSNQELFKDNFGEDIPRYGSKFAKWFNDPQSHSKRSHNATYLGDFFRRMLHSGYDFVIVSAAGNDSREDIGHLESRYASWNNLIQYEYYPEVYDRIIVVGSVDEDMNISWFSNGGNRCDIYAPGNKIFSSVPGNQYEQMQGTSMASPHVAGVAAMVWSANNNLTGAQVKKIVCSSISDSSKTSYPMVDAYKAVQKAHTTTSKGNTYDPNSGAVLGFVVDGRNDNITVNAAQLTFTNKDTGEYRYYRTDKEGHFEAILPEGDYYLAVEANGYPTYSWGGGNETIHISAEEVLYLDWIKMGNINQVSLAGLNWITEPTIEADDIIVGDHYGGGTDYLPPVYIERDGKFGFIDYGGNIVVNPIYDSCNGSYYSAKRKGSEYFGMDSFLAVYDSRTGDTVFVTNAHDSNDWELLEEKGRYGQPENARSFQTYFLNKNDGKVYSYGEIMGAEPVTEYTDKNWSYVVQEVEFNKDETEYDLRNGVIKDKSFFLCDSDGNILTPKYKFAYSNGEGRVSDLNYTPYTTCAFSNDGYFWDIYSKRGYKIVSNAMSFKCNTYVDHYWQPPSEFFESVASAHNNILAEAASFCATEGYIALNDNGKYFYIDTEGNFVTDRIFDDVRPVHYGLAWVKYHGKWGVIALD